MSTSKKIDKLAVQLTKETIMGKVTWSVKSVPDGLAEGTSDIFPLYLECEYKDVDIGIYARRYKHYYDEFEYSWSEDVGICVSGEHSEVLWEYEGRAPSLLNLYDAAKEQASGIGDILDELINE